MAEELKKEAFRNQLKALCPTVDNLRLMLGAARHAFNRHSQAKLEEIAQLQDTITFELDPIFEQIEVALDKSSKTDNPYLIRLHGVLSHLELISHKIAGLADPIRRKGNQGAIFSDTDFFKINDLFSQVTGLMRALVDIFLYDDPSLKAYVQNESQKVKETCYQGEIEHGTQMMDSPGQHNAWSIYITMLDRFGEILDHLMDIGRSFI